MKKFLIKLVVLLFLAGCSNNSASDLKYALQSAGSNRQELEKVLEHYRDSGLKYDAARFLIENMPASYGNTSQALDTLNPLYEAYDSINRKCNFQTTPEWGRKIDSLYEKFPQLLKLSWKTEDLHVIKADYLIHEIDRSFVAWKRNVYSSNCTFEDFCDYILPYRRLNELIVDQARDTFYHRHKEDYYIMKGKQWLEETDSLLYEYSTLKHSGFKGVKIPIMNAETFERLHHGLCLQRCWYNSLLLSSLGMPVAIDFVPAWGNRNNSHTWNVLLLDGTSHAFEAFWDNDRWKYKCIYNNSTSDNIWGKFRLPKVYRHTYSNHPEGPVSDKNVERDDIPSLFRNIKKKDVSAEYFEPQDVTIKLTEAGPEDAKYAYLAVFGYHQWHPVQWGEIKKNGEVTFRGMGKDIVYLPVYFKKGKLYSAAPPFKLESDGNIRILKDDGKRGTVHLRILLGAPSHDRNREYLGNLCGSRFVRLVDGKPQENICLWSDSLEIQMNKKTLTVMSPCRYVRMYLPTDTFSLGEIAFYADKGRISSVKILSNIKSLSALEEKEMLTDGIEATTCKGVVSDGFIDFDLGGCFQLSAIGMYPYLGSQIMKEDKYALQYWDNGWKSKGIKQGTACGWLEFEDIPLNALMMLKNMRWKGATAERTFIYNDGSICWE